jgi:hypothetical protein
MCTVTLAQRSVAVPERDLSEASILEDSDFAGLIGARTAQPLSEGSASTQRPPFGQIARYPPRIAIRRRLRVQTMRYFVSLSHTPDIVHMVFGGRASHPPACSLQGGTP